MSVLDPMTADTAPLTVGTAGWSLPRPVADSFPAVGSGLTRYAARFGGVEINSTFYRSHRNSTYARWRDVTPAGFRFAVKLPREITHKARLVGVDHLVTAFRREVAELGEKLGPLLVQLPPSLAFEPATAEAFLASLREAWPGDIAAEPRHPTWFDGYADDLLRAHRIARVAADPPLHPAAGAPGGWPDFAYWRLHGSPRVYYSAYEEAALAALAAELRSRGACAAWCVFDNTTSGAAAANALRLLALLADP